MGSSLAWVATLHEQLVGCSRMRSWKRKRIDTFEESDALCTRRVVFERADPA